MPSKKHRTFEPEQLLKAVSSLKGNLSEGNDMKTYSQSPLHILVYNEILKFSKEEVDSYVGSFRDGFNFYSACLEIRNPYIFSAFLKIGAFENNLSENSKWIIGLKKNPSDDLYQLVYDIERIRKLPEHYFKSFEEGFPKKDLLFECIMGNYLEDLDTTEKFEVLDKYFKDFGEKNEEQFIAYIFKNYATGGRKELCDYIVVKLKNNNVDLSRNTYLNTFLPTKTHWDTKDTRFFISSSSMPLIKKLLECGFRFDEQNYSYQENNLFISIVKSERKDIIRTILPYLSDITPKSGTLQEQTTFIDNIGKDMTTTTWDEEYKFIKSTYQKCLLDQELGSKIKDKSSKIKI